MGEGRSSEIREMTHRAEEVEGGGGNRTSEQGNKLHILPRFLFMV